jgi:hypothetical protein
MKTLFISLAALVAVSSAALASERGHVPDFDTRIGPKTTNTNALFILKSSKKPTAFESMNYLSEEYKLPGKDNNKGSKH